MDIVTCQGAIVQMDKDDRTNLSYSLSGCFFLQYRIYPCTVIA